MQSRPSPILTAGQGLLGNGGRGVDCKAGCPVHEHEAVGTLPQGEQCGAKDDDHEGSEPVGDTSTYAPRGPLAVLQRGEGIRRVSGVGGE